MICFFCFKQKTTYEMRIGDWSSDVCSSDLSLVDEGRQLELADALLRHLAVQLHEDFAGGVDGVRNGVFRDGDAGHYDIAVGGHDGAVSAALQRAGPGIADLAARQLDLQIALARNGEVTRAVGDLQRRLLADPVDGGGLHADAALPAGGTAGARVAAGGAGAAPLLLNPHP